MPRSWRDSPRQSHPRVVLDTSGLSPEATEFANRLARDIRHLTPESLKSMREILDKLPKGRR